MEARLRVRTTQGLVGVVAALALLLSGCGGGDSTDAAAGSTTDGGSGSTVASSPEEAMQSYVKALNDGDYSAALSLVANPEDVTADSIASLYSSELPEPTVLSGAPEDDANSAVVQFSLAEASPEVSFVKTEDGWLLDRPALLTAYDLSSTGWDAYVAPLEEVADVVVSTPTGATLLPQGYIIDNPDAPNTEAPVITVALAGKYRMPDQTLDTDLNYDGSIYSLELSYDGIALGGLEDAAANLLIDQTQMKSDYIAKDSPHFRFQYQTVTGVDNCQLLPVDGSGRRRHLSEGLQLLCGASLNATTTDGNPVFENYGDEFIYQGATDKCIDKEPEVSQFLTSTGMTFSIKDGVLTALWNDPDGYPARFDEGSISVDSCGLYGDVKVGDVFFGLVPKASEDADEAVAINLADGSKVSS